VAILEAPIALTGALTGPPAALIAPTAPAAPTKRIPTSSPYLQEPVLDNYPTHKLNDSRQLDGIGGYIGEGSWGGHTDEDVYGVSDGEQEAQRPAVHQQDDQDDAEIAQLATRLGGQSLESSGSPIPEREPALSPIPKPTSSPIPEPTGSPIPEREPTRSRISEREPSEVELGESSTATRLLKQLFSVGMLNVST
jgi:hypothetical protein